MSEYEVVSYEVKPVEGDEQVELVIHASDGSRWEYGIPYSVSSGRYTFEEVDVLAIDFGDEFADEVTAKLDEHENQIPAPLERDAHVPTRARGSIFRSEHPINKRTTGL